MAHNLPYYKKKSDRAIRERITDFLDSDSKYATATNILLATIAIGSIVVVGAIAPNLMQLLGHKRGRGIHTEKQYQHAVDNLNRHGFVKILRHNNGSTEIILTNKGMRRVRNFSFKQLLVKRQRKWDRKWRIVVFDIPIAHNQARRALRRKIKNIGFYQLQQSVWIYPFPCEDELLFIAHVFEVENCINILTIERMLHEERLREIFKLHN